MNIFYIFDDFFPTVIPKPKSKKPFSFLKYK